MSDDFDEYEDADNDFYSNPPPDWFCANCDQLFDQDELNDDNLCPDCAEQADEW